jgi:hypothetical protein
VEVVEMVEILSVWPGVSSVSIKQEAIGIRKYKEMLMNVVKDVLEIMGYGKAEKIESEIFGIITKRPKRKKDVSLDDNIHHQQQRQH